VLAFGFVPARAGVFQLFCGGGAVGRVEVEIDGGAAAAVQVDGDAAEHRRVHAVAQPPRDRKNVAVVSRHADPELRTEPAATDAERRGHKETIPWGETKRRGCETAIAPLGLFGLSCRANSTWLDMVGTRRIGAVDGYGRL